MLYLFSLNVILFSTLIKYIHIEESTIYSKKSWISNVEYILSGNSNSLFCVGAEILYLLFLYDFFIFFPYIVNAKIW